MANVFSDKCSIRCRWCLSEPLLYAPRSRWMSYDSVRERACQHVSRNACWECLCRGHIWAEKAWIWNEMTFDCVTSRRFVVWPRAPAERRRTGEEHYVCETMLWTVERACASVFVCLRVWCWCDSFIIQESADVVVTGQKPRVDGELWNMCVQFVITPVARAQLLPTSHCVCVCVQRWRLTLAFPLIL